MLFKNSSLNRKRFDAYSSKSSKRWLCIKRVGPVLIMFIVSSTLAGLLAGLFGIGGGALIIPILTAIYKSSGTTPTDSIRLAFGTSLAIMAFTGLSSFLSHMKAGNVDLAWFKKLYLASGVGAFVGALIATRIPGIWLTIALAGMLFYFGAKLLGLFAGGLEASPLFARFYPVAGLFSGATYSLAGLGGASVMTFYLMKVGLPLRRAIGTATGVILPISVGAVLGFGITSGIPHDWRWGYIDLYALLVMSACSIPASKVGVRLAGLIPTDRLRKAFGLLMVGLAIKTAAAMVL